MCVLCMIFPNKIKCQTNSLMADKIFRTRTKTIELERRKKTVVEKFID